MRGLAQTSGRLGLLGLLCAGGCLDPMAGDEPGFSPQLLPRDAEVPLVTENAALTAQIDRYDGIDGEQIERRTGFVDGESIRFWDFGSSPASVAPVWLFRERKGDGEREIGHMNLIDVVPGDPGYTPYWAMYKVFVTERYDGQRITSAAALQDAIALGLVEEPLPVGMVANCPVVLPETRLEVGGGEPDEAPHEGYYRGHRVHYYHFENFALRPQDGDDEREVRAPAVPSADVYELLRADDRQPLSEPLVSRDLSGDGDTDDTNDIFVVPRDDGDYHSLSRVVRVAVASDYEFGEIKSASELVERAEDEEQTGTDSASLRDGLLEPVQPWALWVEETDELVNRPQQLEPGAP